MRTKVVFSALIVGMCAAICGPVAAADAQTVAGAATTGRADGPVYATYQSQRINLASDWAGAKACLVWRAHNVAECFASDAQLDAAEAQLRPTHTSGTTRTFTAMNGTASPAITTCSSSLDLYSGSSYTGLHLALWDEGYWQELSDYGFDNMTRSFLGGACSFHLAQGDYGQGYWYPGSTIAWSFAADMGTWDDTVSSVFIN